jgi:hypothetical protein
VTRSLEKLSTILAVSVSLFFPASVWAQTANACDLNRDGVVNTLDVQLAVKMALGLAPCTANVAGAGVCDTVMIQRVIIADLGATCVTTSLHRVTLNWTASTSPNVVGYNVYRTTQSGGPYIKFNFAPIVGTSYTDIAVRASQTYYYVTTAVDSNNNESIYSNEARATVPTP